MSTVFKVLPRGSKVLISGLLNDPDSKKNGKLVLLECSYDLKAGFSLCNNMISFSKTSIYLDFDSKGMHLDAYTDANGAYQATVYQMDPVRLSNAGMSVTPGPDKVSS